MAPRGSGAARRTVAATKSLGVMLTVASGAAYACGYLVQRARAHALGTEPDFALLDEAYVFAGFRFALNILVALLVVLPLLFLLQAAVRRLLAPFRDRGRAAVETLAALGLALAALATFSAMMSVSEALLSPAPSEGPSRLLWDAVLGRGRAGTFLTLGSVTLAASAVLWLRSRLMNGAGGALTAAVALVATLLVVMLPIQHGMFFAGRKARVLESLPEGLAGAVPPGWVVDRGSGSAVLMARNATGQARLFTVKAERLEQIGVTGTVDLGTFAGRGGQP
jgi:hypothetical protein